MQETRHPANDHIGYLDSIRGIAALIVLIYHYCIWHWQTTLTKSLCIVFNGADAVSFFFVLSGFVLSYKYIVLGHPLDMRKFAVNRLFRLLPGFFVAVIATAVYSNSKPFTTQGMLDLFIYNRKSLYQELFLFRSLTTYYGAGWSLMVELMVSLFVPFAVIIAKKDKRFLIALLATACVMGGGFMASYFVHFLLGITLAMFYFEIISPSFRQTWWYRYRWILLPVAILLYSLRRIHHLSPLGPSLIYMLDYLRIDFYLMSSFAAFIFLGGILHSTKVQKMLDVGIWRFYGRISYGIYLMHWVVVAAIYDHWDKIHPFFPNQRVAFVAMFFVCLAVSTILAYIVHYTVELPFIRYGKRLTHRMKPSLIVE
jgi:peptidoglycan/LPS O-acetylase OafA/YrhL